jgi:glutathione S-transferase
MVTTPFEGDAMLTLYYAPRTRSIRALWMLEEIGCPYEAKIVDVMAGKGRTAEYLALNAHGKVPTLIHDGAVIPDSTAILLYLADSFPEAKLGPPVGDPARGPYLAWMLYTTGVLEPALTAKANGWVYTASRVAWGSYDDLVTRLRSAASRPYVMGDHFTAADILIGGTIRFASQYGWLPKEPAFDDYMARLAERPAFQRAAKMDAG